MKKAAAILLSLLLALYPSFSQNEDGLFHSEFEQSSFSSFELDKILFATAPDVDLNKYNEYKLELNDLTQKVNKAHKWSDDIISEKLFYLLHRKLLKRYENYASFGEIFTNGAYDCVSGTALLALALNDLEINYTIYEFDYHAFLIVHSENGDVLLESTDPFNGVVRDMDEIERRIAVYGEGGDPRTDSIEPVGSKTNTHSTHINNKIGLNQLTGLQYFNLAVRDFNAGNKDHAITLIEKAYMLYPSERIRDVRRVFTIQRLVTTR